MHICRHVLIISAWHMCVTNMEEVLITKKCTQLLSNKQWDLISIDILIGKGSSHDSKLNFPVMEQLKMSRLVRCPVSFVRM